MNVRNFIYFMPLIISFFSIISIILAIKNKEKSDNKYIIIADIVNILYLFIVSTLLHGLLPIIVGLEIIIIWIISIFGGIIYIISILICLIKSRKLKNINDSKSAFRLVLMVILIPIIIFILSLGKELYLINNSDILLSYYSSGNGGLGDSNDFVYAISDRYCEEISMDVSLAYGYYNKIFLPKKIKKITENELQKLGVEVEISKDRYIKVYKNSMQIHNEKMNHKYFNISLEDIYYINQVVF